MNGEVWITLLLLCGTALEILCGIGLWAGRNPYARLHFLGPASVVGPLLIAAAVWIETSLFSASGVKVLLILCFVAATGPVLTHATARMVYSAEAGEEARGGETD